MTAWPAVHAERAALADDLEQLNPGQWSEQSLCGRWTVDEVVTHLTAAASIGQVVAVMIGQCASDTQLSRSSNADVVDSM